MNCRFNPRKLGLGEFYLTVSNDGIDFAEIREDKFVVIYGDAASMSIEIVRDVDEESDESTAEATSSESILSKPIESEPSIDVPSWRLHVSDANGFRLSDVSSDNAKDRPWIKERAFRSVLLG